MKKLILLALAALLAAPAFASPSSGNISTLSFGGSGSQSTNVQSLPEAKIVTDISNSLDFFVLNTTQGGTAGNFQIWYKNGDQYRVPLGSTAHCYNFSGHTAAANTSYQLAYDDTVFANNTGPLTNGKYQGGATTKYVFTMYSTIWTSFALTFDFPSQSYPALQKSNDDSSAQFLTCRETIP